MKDTMFSTSDATGWAVWESPLTKGYDWCWQAFYNGTRNFGRCATEEDALRAAETFLRGMRIWHRERST